MTAHSVIKKKKAQEDCPVAETLNAALSGLTGPRTQGTGVQGSRALTQFPDLQDLTQHLGELNRTAAKGALVLVFSATVLQDNLRARRGGEGGRGEAGEGASVGAAGPSLYPDVGVLVDFRQVQHVVQGQHPRRSLGEVHRGVDVVLGKERHLT